MGRSSHRHPYASSSLVDTAALPGDHALFLSKRDHCLSGGGLMADRIGQQLGNYRLVRVLGRGGFAEVYLGEQVDLGTQVAIKVLHAQLTTKDLERFNAEASTIARL